MGGLAHLWPRGCDSAELRPRSSSRKVAASCQLALQMGEWLGEDAETQSWEAWASSRPFSELPFPVCRGAQEPGLVRRDEANVVPFLHGHIYSSSRSSRKHIPL